MSVHKVVRSFETLNSTCLDVNNNTFFNNRIFGSRSRAIVGSFNTASAILESFLGFLLDYMEVMLNCSLNFVVAFS